MPKKPNISPKLKSKTPSQSQTKVLKHIPMNSGPDKDEIKVRNAKSSTPLSYADILNSSDANKSIKRVYFPVSTTALTSPLNKKTDSAQGVKRTSGRKLKGKKEEDFVSWSSDEDEEDYATIERSPKKRTQVQSMNSANSSENEDEPSRYETTINDVVKSFSNKQPAKRHPAALKKDVKPSEAEETAHIDNLYDSIFPPETEPKIKSKIIKFVENHAKCPNASVSKAQIGCDRQTSLSVSDMHEIKNVNDILYEKYMMTIQRGGEKSSTEILVPASKEPTPNNKNAPTKLPLHEAHDSLCKFDHDILLYELGSSILKVRNYQEEINTLKERYVTLFEEYNNSPQFSTIADLVGASAKFLSEDQLVLYLMQLKGASSSTQGLRYSVKEKVIALAMYQQYPTKYSYLCKLFNLPSPLLLQDWLETLAKTDPKLAKNVMYYTYVNHVFTPAP